MTLQLSVKIAQGHDGRDLERHQNDFCILPPWQHVDDAAYFAGINISIIKSALLSLMLRGLIQTDAAFSASAFDLLNEADGLLFKIREVPMLFSDIRAANPNIVKFADSIRDDRIKRWFATQDMPEQIYQDLVRTASSCAWLYKPQPQEKEVYAS